MEIDMYFVLTVLGLLLLLGGVIAGRTLLSVAVSRLTNSATPAEPARPVGYTNSEKDAALSTLWAIFLIGTISGGILLSIGADHFLSSNPEANSTSSSTRK